MSVRGRELLAEALLLDEEERAALAEALWASLHGEPETLRLSPAWSDEVDDRIASLRRGESRAIPWDEVAARIRGPLDGR
ncbi:MAG: addiction module protein [Nannocystaceae bacterium]